MMCRNSEAGQNPDFWHFSLCSVLLAPKDRLPPPGFNNPLLVSHLNHSTAELEDSDFMDLNLLS